MLASATRSHPIALKPEPQDTHAWHLIVDGDAVAPIAMPPSIMDLPKVSEALMPKIRLVACLVAAERHDFKQRSPSRFTEEADWFAARILVLQARRFFLDVTLLPMLALANERAAAFAQRHGLAFVAAEGQLSLHAGRPHHTLIVETPALGDVQLDRGLLHNSLLLRQLSRLA